MKDFNKIKRGFETYYTLLDQGNAKLSQAAELLKKIEEEFNGKDGLTKKRGPIPSELRINILSMMKNNVNRCWTTKELSEQLKAEPKKVFAVLANAHAAKQISRKSPGKYFFKAA